MHWYCCQCVLRVMSALCVRYTSIRVCGAGYLSILAMLRSQANMLMESAMRLMRMDTQL